MKHVYKQNRAFFGKPYILSPEQQNDPISVFESFFDFQHLEQAREYLGELLKLVMTSDKDEFCSPQSRETAIYSFMKLEELIEAAFLVMNNAKTA